MREIGAFDAKDRLGAMLNRVERGVETVITRQTLAKLVPAAPGFDRNVKRFDSASRHGR
jgi:antitoxin (DNA-binding transcriptional repressor) of toxin-antitoxin stability system